MNRTDCSGWHASQRWPKRVSAEGTGPHAGSSGRTGPSVTRFLSSTWIPTSARARSKTFSAAFRTASTADARLAPLPSGARRAGRRRCPALRRALEPAWHGARLHVGQRVPRGAGILRPPRPGGRAARPDPRPGRHPARRGSEGASQRRAARRLAFAARAGGAGRTGHAAARERRALGAVGRRAGGAKLPAQSRASGVSSHRLRPRPPVLLRPENVEKAAAEEVTAAFSDSDDCARLPAPLLRARRRHEPSGIGDGPALPG